MLPQRVAWLGLCPRKVSAHLRQHSGRRCITSGSQSSSQRLLLTWSREGCNARLKKKSHHLCLVELKHLGKYMINCARILRHQSWELPAGNVDHHLLKADVEMLMHVLAACELRHPVRCVAAQALTAWL